MLKSGTLPANAEGKPFMQGERSHSIGGREDMPATQTLPNSEALPDKSGSSAVFSLSVGPEKRPLFAHQSVLSQSPVLARFCQPGFRESEVMHIDLPEDDPDVFGRLLEYLYPRDYSTTFTRAYDLADELASIYILAEKYQLKHLQSLTVQKLKNVNALSRTPRAFFAISQHIYANTPDSEPFFRKYFLEEAPGCIEAMGTDGANEISELIILGGSFAVDVFEAQRQALAMVQATQKQFGETIMALQVKQKQSEQTYTALQAKQKRSEQAFTAFQGKQKQSEKSEEAFMALQLKERVSDQAVKAWQAKYERCQRELKACVTDRDSYMGLFRKCKSEHQK
ncbi:MAG: hypothetical protein M1830_008845 [Pleopsidium flavum]|nr:MAG: hypothetical protein M1830_008845 [Pleopsidium flavum]